MIQALLLPIMGYHNKILEFVWHWQQGMDSYRNLKVHDQGVGVCGFMERVFFVTWRCRPFLYDREEKSRKCIRGETEPGIGYTRGTGRKWERDQLK